MFRFASELYYNLVAAEPIPYIGDSGYLGGFMIEGTAHRRVQQRTVYSISDWLGEVGGFASTMHLIFGILFSILRVWSIEKYLIK